MAIVKATGYTVAELSGFLEIAESLSSEADITDEFTKYLFSVKDTTPVAEFTKNCTANADNTEPHECCMQRYNCKNSEDYEIALKEIVQEVALMGLSRSDFFSKAAFYGGTALRIKLMFSPGLKQSVTSRIRLSRR